MTVLVSRLRVARSVAMVAGVSLIFGLVTAIAPPSARADLVVDGFNPSADGQVMAALELPDGKIMFGGFFTSIGGVNRNAIARVNADGSLDTSFDLGLNSGSSVRSLVLQPDGKILVGGQFTSVAGQPVGGILRINPDGSLDRLFEANADGLVYAVALQADGRILIGGTFPTVNDQPRPYIARLNPDGSIDQSFAPNLDRWVTAIVVQSDGHIVIGGWFSNVANTAIQYLARLTAAGTVDLSFSPQPDFHVWTLALEPDGSILVGGSFARIGNLNRSNMARVEVSGAVDPSFDPKVASRVSNIVRQPDGKILIGGAFTFVDGQSRVCFARLNEDGSLDTTAIANIAGREPISVNALALRADGGIVIGGDFSLVNGVVRNSIAALSYPILPSAPTNVVAQPGGAKATLTWQAPASSGTSPITHYEYSLDGGGIWTAFSPSVTESPGTIEGLINGKPYSVSLRAVSADGAGAASVPVAVTPRTTPARPQDLEAVSGDGQATISFEAGSDGGSPVTNYEYSVDFGVTWTPFSPAAVKSPVTITGLVNGTVYSAQIRAVNAAGPGDSSNGVVLSPQAALPGAPVLTEVDPGDRSAVVFFTAPTSGGTPTNYEYSLNGGAWAALTPSTTVSPVTVGGLTNDVAYGIRLRAVTAAGGGPASNSVSVTPEAPEPNAPRDLVARPGDAEATITFTPGPSGGSPVTNYEFTLNGGSTWAAFAPAITGSPARITGLVNGTTYQVRLRAVNASGEGAASSTVSVTPRSVPGVPTNLVAQAGKGQAVISFTDAADSGSPITNYEYSVNQGDWKAFAPAAVKSPVTVPNLPDGKASSIRLRAINAVGTGGPSAAVSVTPRTVPDAPVLTGAVGAPRSAVVSFAQDWSGGSPITNYEYAIDDGAWRAMSPATVVSPITIAGLTDGKAIAVRLRAVNAAGPSEPSAPKVVTPGRPPDPAAPSQPRNVRASAGDGEVLVTWQSPSVSGSSPISAYKVTAQPGGRTCEPLSMAVLACVVDGLTNDSAYTFTVTATNGEGTSRPSAKTPEVTPRPDRPDAILITGKRGATTSNDNRVFVVGVAPSLTGVVVTPRVKLPGQPQYVAGSGTRTISPSGDFDWSRRTGKKVYVYFTTEDGIRSNMVTIPERARR